MSQKISSEKRAYLAGFLDGDGSIYVRMKPNKSYRFGFQIAPYIILFQSKKDEQNFKKLCSLIKKLGYMRERKDGILEYTIARKDSILEFLSIVKPYSILKKKQIVLMEKIFSQKEKVKTEKDFQKLADLIDEFRNLNYSKKRTVHKLTP